MIEQQIILIKKLLVLLTLAVSMLQNPAQTTENPMQFGGLGAVTKLTDYKLWYVKRYDDGKIYEVAVRFYEGAITTENEDVMRSGVSTITPVTRYRRSKRLTKTEIPHIPEKFIKETSGNDVKIYTSNDFGVISTNEQLRTFLNSELSKDINREPIAQQKNL